jgi:hypothetical protein
MRAEAGCDPLLLFIMRLRGFDAPILNQANALYKRNEPQVPGTFLHSPCYPLRWVFPVIDLNLDGSAWHLFGEYV